MVFIRLIVFGFIMILPASLQAQETLTNGDIIQMVKAGFDEATIIQAIEAGNPDFDTSVQGLISLKNAGVSEEVIRKMLGTVSQTDSSSEASPSEEPVVGDFPNEIGIYIKKDSKWEDVEPEIVNWQTGGWLKTVVTAGIVKGDVNGRINGSHSRNYLKTPMEFIIVTPEGVHITEYQLVHLHEKSDRREFRTVTGGVLHTSGGSTRDLLQFEGEKVASCTFLVKLPTLGAGEYGFLPPTGLAGSSSSSSGNLGKMYTFRVSE